MPSSIQKSRTLRRALIGVLGTSLAALLASSALAAPLPDERVYEMVTPVKKTGQGGYSGGAFQGTPSYTRASSDGGGVLFGSTQPFGQTDSGVVGNLVSRRTSTGWDTRSIIPRPIGPQNFFFTYPLAVIPSDDLTREVFVAGNSFIADNPDRINGQSPAVYRTEPGAAPTWLSRPTSPDATPRPGYYFGVNGQNAPSGQASNFAPAGASPDLGTVFFSSVGTLLPGEAARAPHYNPVSGDVARGFYRFTDGTLTAAGVLPDGSLDEFGAVQAGSVAQSINEINNTAPNDANNQVSTDGSHAFFLSPDPNSQSSRPPQLYVRINGTRTVLLSHGVAPAALSPTGVEPLAARQKTEQGGAGSVPSYAYASPDGARVFFRSRSALTGDAPDDGASKLYSANSDDGALDYLPSLDGAIFIASSADGSRVLLGSGPDVAGAERILLLEGNTTRLVAQTDLPGILGLGRATSNGAVFVFETNEALSGFNNGGGFSQIYKVDGSSGSIACISCPPVGTEPTGDSHFTRNFFYNPPRNSNGFTKPSRGMSDDGKRVFFDSPAALVARDRNGRRDVYQNQDGRNELISTGGSSTDSFFLDNSSSGDDVFFSTGEGIAPADTDGALDIYDARVGGGFPAAAASPSPCFAGCRPSGPGASLPPIATDTSSGRGNAVDRPAPRLSVSLPRSAIRGTTARIVVRVPAAGTITITGADIGSVRSSFARAGRRSLRLRLNRSAARALRNRARKANIAIRFAPRSGRGSTRTATLRFAKAKGKR